MSYAWTLGKLAGIDVRVHWTFLLLPIWIYFSSLVGGSGTASAIVSVLFVLAVFGCVVLHELGHALAARYFGIETRHITLLPIGGVASLMRMPRAPWQEFVIAVAGPAVNVVIAAALLAAAIVATISEPAFASVPMWLQQLALVNLALVVFNMVPAFPMDGGRVLRSILASRLSYQRATEIAVAVGKVAAVGIGLLGLMVGNVFMVLIAGFVFLAANGEAALVAGQYERQSAPKAAQIDSTSSTGMNHGDNDQSLPIVSGQCSARSVLGWMSGRSAGLCLVSKEGVIIGLLSHNDLVRAVINGQGQAAVENLCLR